jgi:hypothetical protein
VVVYELLTGKRPYDGDPMEVMRMSNEGNVPLPSSIDGKLAPLDGPLFRALNPVRGKRTRSVELFLGELYEQLVVLAPEFDPDDVKHLVKFLFEDDIAAEHGGKRPRIPAGYMMRMDKWLASPPPEPGPAGDTASSSMSLPRVPLGHAEPTGLHQSDQERDLARASAHRRRRVTARQRVSRAAGARPPPRRSGSEPDHTGKNAPLVQPMARPPLAVNPRRK